MQKNYLELANTVAMNGAVLPHFRKTDSIMYLPLMKPVREKMRRLNLFDTTESFEAFTLAETLITLTILGVVAAITVPSLINRQMEAANRTKVKKAMAVYEKALNQMIIENDLKSDGAITTEFPSGTCTKTTEYFKKIKEDSACVFQTADRVWWNITNIENPYIILKEENKGKTLEQLKTLAQDTTDKTVYGLVGYMDSNGILRINDKGVENATSDRGKYLAKLYGFMNNETSGGSTPVDPSRACSDSTKNGAGNYVSCTFTKESGDPMIIPEMYDVTKIIYDDQGRVSEFNDDYGNYGIRKYNADGTSISSVYSGDSDKCKIGNTSGCSCNYSYVNDSMSGETCTVPLPSGS